MIRGGDMKKWKKSGRTREERIAWLREARLARENSPELQAEADAIFESLPVIHRGRDVEAVLLKKKPEEETE
jgi:hypothetical protein